jgi:hypothetical protein
VARVSTFGLRTGICRNRYPRYLVDLLMEDSPCLAFVSARQKHGFRLPNPGVTLGNMPGQNEQSSQQAQRCILNKLQQEKDRRASDSH